MELGAWVPCGSMQAEITASKVRQGFYLYWFNLYVQDPIDRVEVQIGVKRNEEC